MKVEGRRPRTQPVAQAFLPAVSQVFQPAGVRLSRGSAASADKNVGDTAGRNACATPALS
jgi:hypothetical protein